MLCSNFFSKHASSFKKAVFTASAAIALTFTAASDVLAANERMKPLTGLYILDGNRGTYRDVNIRDYDFVDGYTWRFSWADMEPKKGEYDFRGLEHIVKRLSAIDKKLSWIIMADLPDYLAKEPGMDTYIYNNKAIPSPWDEKLLARYEAFVKAVSMHRMPDPKRDGRMIPFKWHSVNAILHPTFPGTPRGGMRDEGIKIKDIPGYSRSKLIDGNVDFVAELFRKTFPKQALFFSLWPINDNDRSKPLWEDLQDKFSEYWNTGIWMDNLAASRDCTYCEPYKGYPQVSWAKHMTNVSDRLMTGFQMLGTWDRPFNVNHVPKVKNGTPMDGMEFAMDKFDSQYFEVYIWDIERKDWQAGLKEYQQRLHQ